jgi:hypothetical protein
MAEPVQLTELQPDIMRVLWVRARPPWPTSAGPSSRERELAPHDGGDAALAAGKRG